MGRFRPSPAIVFWALSALALLVSHDAIWIVQTGPAEDLASALRATQHGYLAAASVAVLLLAVGAALATGARTASLARRARDLDAPVSGPGGRRVLVRGAVTWVRLFALVGVGFAIQENVEHYLAHGHVLGWGAVSGPEYPLALPALAAVTAAAALLWAVVGSVEAELIAGIAAAYRRSRLRPARSRQRGPDLVPPRRRPAMAGSDAGRAPPILLVGS